MKMRPGTQTGFLLCGKEWIEGEAFEVRSPWDQGLVGRVTVAARAAGPGRTRGSNTRFRATEPTPGPTRTCWPSRKVRWSGRGRSRSTTATICSPSTARRAMIKNSSGRTRLRFSSGRRKVRPSGCRLSWSTRSSGTYSHRSCSSRTTTSWPTHVAAEVTRSRTAGIW